MIVKDKRIGTPREILCKDLIKFLIEIKSSGDKILIMGDFNEVISNKSGIFKVYSEIGLIDLMESKMGYQNFSTHIRNRSNERIDYAIGSAELASSIKNAFIYLLENNLKVITEDSILILTPNQFLVLHPMN